ncbi:MAG TPA: acyl--CoA ligase [Burkholderiales bacterium]|jgi:acyl-CoA synthetase (AMP-forming)/AMP-acid ligase II|nr:acyl--CoA ligase [Burkholderiales bacterium]
MSDAPTSVLDLLEAGAPGATALSTPGGVPLTYQALRRLARDTLSALNAHAIGRNDRVAIVLDNGPEMAAAFVSVAAGATAAPLNPSYRADEFEFYLTDLNARLLIIERGKASPAIAVASKLGVPIAQVDAMRDRGAGCFTLLFPEGYSESPTAHPGPAEADDIALVLHTSGTTSRPKIVPLAQRNVCASARNVRQTLAFSGSDRGLNIMPLFHIHGLIAGILAPLAAGGEVCCTTGFNALKFFSWMAEVRPTWYTAVPTMHQAILSRAANNVEVIKANPLRFIRSSSSSMPPQVIKGLEAVFGAPVIESYGMTEAAHQMASNPLPPALRKPGTVGTNAGPEVCVIDADGNPMTPGVAGEIAIRGENVMSGYENNSKANAEAFAKGWFRTGDQGVMDADGYLTITGRLKEIINRGGEKISPREVDEVLMDHPAVQQCVTFAVPHDRLGEDVAAAVVLREGVQASEKDLREFAAKRVADFKVPRRILIVAEIPKGATGKLQRIGLAQKLGLAPEKAG